MGHTFSSLKTKTTKLPIYHSETYPAFFTPRDEKPSLSSSEEKSLEFDWLERKITRKQKYIWKVEQVLCRYISYLYKRLSPRTGSPSYIVYQNYKNNIYMVIHPFS